MDHNAKQDNAKKPKWNEQIHCNTTQYDTIHSVKHCVIIKSIAVQFSLAKTTAYTGSAQDQSTYRKAIQYKTTLIKLLWDQLLIG